MIGTSRSADKLEKLKPCTVSTPRSSPAATVSGPRLHTVIGEKGVDMIVDNIGGDVLGALHRGHARLAAATCTIGRMSGVLKGELERRSPRRVIACIFTASATGCAARRSAPNRCAASSPI